MDGIKAWAIALCAAAVGCSLLHMLAPKGGMGRLFKLIIAAFFLCCMIAPLMNLKSMTLPELSEALKAMGQPAFRARQLYTWLHRGARSYEEMTNLPAALRERLQHDPHKLLALPYRAGVALQWPGLLAAYTIAKQPLLQGQRS